jgi:anti-sigma28 factor (negative regulator of flagellin synthesis)
MKIYDSNTSGIPAGGAQRTQETQQADRSSAGRSTTAGSGNGDRVEFSGTLGRLSRVLSTFQADRSNRVQALAAQYQSGTYQPDSAATSRAIIAESLGGAAETRLQ